MSDNAQPLPAVPPYDVACPTCGAVVGELCRLLSSVGVYDTPVLIVGTHGARQTESATWRAANPPLQPVVAPSPDVPPPPVVLPGPIPPLPDVERRVAAADWEPDALIDALDALVDEHGAWTVVDALATLYPTAFSHLRPV